MIRPVMCLSLFLMSASQNTSFLQSEGLRAPSGAKDFNTAPSCIAACDSQT